MIDEVTGPLSGIRVLDLSRVLAGPYCTMVLGDLGADVIKVERPGSGDDTRAWGPPWSGGESAYYLSVNRNKRSITLDIKQPEAKQIIKDIAAQSDIVVENYRLGTLEKLGIGYEQVREINPRLIWATISGYGPDGPFADKPGYDFVAQGEAGLMAITGEPDGDPMKLGVAIVDVTTGLYTAVAVLAALRERETSGFGQRVDSNLMSSAVASLINVGSNHLVSGKPAKRFGNAHANIVPYQVFKARDQHITVAVGNDAQFRALCRILGIPEYGDDPRFSTNPARVEHREVLVAKIQEIIETRDAQEWLDQITAAGIPSGPINSIEQVFTHPQVLARNMVVEAEHPTAGSVRMAGIPFELSRTPAVVRNAPPLLGQHTAEILGEVLGKSADDINSLRERGVL